MPCNASYARFIFGKFFTSTIILYILLFAQNFYSCKKWVLQPRHPTPVYEIALYYPADLPTSSTLGGAPHRFESLCMAAPPLRLDITGTLDRDNYLPVFSWNIELLIFGSNS
jgi:hypothetical protein